ILLHEDFVQHPLLHLELRDALYVSVSSGSPCFQTTPSRPKAAITMEFVSFVTSSSSIVCLFDKARASLSVSYACLHRSASCALSSHVDLGTIRPRRSRIIAIPSNVGAVNPIKGKPSIIRSPPQKLDMLCFLYCHLTG